MSDLTEVAADAPDSAGERLFNAQGREIGPNAPLSPRLEMFCAEYIINMDAQEAAGKAGYASSTGYALLKRDDVKRRLAALQAARAQRLQVTADEVIAGIRRVQAAAEADGDYGPALKALELLGKHVGMFAERVQVTHSMGPTMVTWEQLEAIATQPAAIVDASADAQHPSGEPVEAGIDE